MLFTCILSRGISLPRMASSSGLGDMGEHQHLEAETSPSPGLLLTLILCPPHLHGPTIGPFSSGLLLRGRVEA